MSSFDGTVLESGQNSDPGLLTAPTEGSGPDFGLLKKAFDDCVNGLQPYIDQCQLNYRTRYALWSGQTADGKKHIRGSNGQTDPVPWDGASDLRVFLTDEAINAKVALLCSAFRKANVVAVPVEGNDLRRAKNVSNFMRWLIQTQIPEIDREVELLANYLNEKGVAATGQFWEYSEQKTLVTLTIPQLQEQYPNQDVMALIADEAATDQILGLFEEIYGASKGKARRMLSQLRTTGSTTVPMVGKRVSRPVIRAFNLDQDLFVPQYTTDLETAPRIFRVQYFTAEQLRSFVNTDGWNAEWVEDAIEKCRGKLITLGQNEYNQPIARSLVYTQQQFSDQVGCVYAYERLSDEDGVPGIYLTIFNPLMGPDGSEHDGYAKHELLDYGHGEMPFVLHRREYLSRKLHDSRGIPEPGQPAQDQIKVHRDSRIDAASLAICPPLMYPVGRPPGRWGAGARVPERRPGEYHYADRPMPDLNTEKSEEILTAEFNRYYGFVSRDTDPTFASLKNQTEVDKFLSCWSKAMRQVWALYKRFGSEQVYFRVSGLREVEPVEFNRGDPGEEFDFCLRFSVDSLDPEQTFTKLEQIAKIIATADRDGVVNYSEWLSVMLEAVDPNIAERIIDPKTQGQQRIVADLQDSLAKVFAGQEQDIKLGTPPDLGLSVIQNYVQGDPVVQRRMMDKQDPFASRIEKLAKQLNFQKTQQENAKIGRLGA